MLEAILFYQVLLAPQFRSLRGSLFGFLGASSFGFSGSGTKQNPFLRDFVIPLRLMATITFLDPDIMIEFFLEVPPGANLGVVLGFSVGIRFHFVVGLSFGLVFACFAGAFLCPCLACSAFCSWFDVRFFSLSLFLSFSHFHLSVASAGAGTFFLTMPRSPFSIKEKIFS